MLKLTKVLLLIVGLMFIFSSVSLAQDIPKEVQMDETVEASDLEVSEPTLLPDSPFYFLKNWGRGIRTFFAFRPVDKANLRLKFSSEKLLEARKLAQKTKNPDILKKATENYNKEIDKLKDVVDKIKEKAAQNPKVGKFLDKFTKQTFLHEKILEKLEQQVPTSTFEKIKKAREKHLRRFGEVIQKLEEKTKIPERLEKNLEALRGSRFKNFKNLEILKRLEERALSTSTKEAIRKVRERILGNLKKKAEQMSTTTQERFKDYIEKIRGEAESKMEILENLKSELKERPKIQERLKNIRERILEKIQEMEKKTGCPEIEKPAPGFCPTGRIIPQRDEKGCITSFQCIIPGEEEIKPSPTPPEVEAPKAVCISLWNPVCGVDGKTYSNACFAKVAGVKIDYRGICKREFLKNKIEKFGR